MKRSIRSVCSMGLAACALLLLFAPAARARTLVMAIGDVKGSAQHEVAKKFSEVLGQKTSGGIAINILADGQAGSEQDTINECAMGALDLSVIAINNLSPFSPTLGVLSLPYVIQSLEDAVTLTQGKIGKRLVRNTVSDAGVRILAWSYTGFRVLTNSKKPVRTLEDLQGLVIRVPKNPIMINTYESWGISPSPLAWNQAFFDGLREGIVDGQCNPLPTVEVMKFYESQKYITTLRYCFSLEPLVISEEVYRNQPPEIQKALKEAGKAATRHSQEFLAASEAAARKNLQAKGMVITAPADNEKRWIERATTTVWPLYYKRIGGKAKLERVLKALGRSM